MNNFFLKLLVNIFLISMLAACANTAGSGPTATPAAAYPPTWTPRPTVTAYPAPTRRPTPGKIIPTMTANATEAAHATLRASFGSCDPNDGSKLSPKKDWYLCGSGHDFAAVNKNGTTWKFSVQKEFGIEYHGDFSFLYWTADEKFLYFAVQNPVEGGAPLATNAEALFRMDLTSGAFTTTLGGIAADPQNQKLYTVSISPTSRRLAYAGGYTQGELHLIDLQNSDEKVIPLEPEYTQIGGFAWSEDGMWLAFKLYTERSGSSKYFYSIRLLNLADYSAITFVKNMTAGQSTETSVEFNIVSVSAKQVVLEKDKEIWSYDVEQQNLKVDGTQTPAP
jgi:WD40 repeat protein